MAKKPTPDEIKLPTYIDDLVNVGIDGAYLAKKHKEELTAMETKFFQHEGEVVEQVDVIAWHIRQKARMDANKARGDYPAEKLDHTVTVENEMALAVRVHQESKKNTKAKND